MTEEIWTTTDSYFESQLLDADPSLDAVMAANASAGLPPHDVTALQAKFLHLLVRLHNSHRILEIGTLGGYSTVWLARALPPGGSVTTLELNSLHADVAAQNFENCGVSSRIDIVRGDACASLERLVSDAVEPFDFVFIDADKASNVQYFRWCLRLVADRAVIVVDNVVRDGAVVDDSSIDPSVAGIRDLVAVLNREPCVSATAVQTVGRKGYDGFIVACVNRPATVPA